MRTNTHTHTHNTGETLCQRNRWYALIISFVWLTSTCNVWCERLREKQRKLLQYLCVALCTPPGSSHHLARALSLSIPPSPLTFTLVHVCYSPSFVGSFIRFSPFISPDNNVSNILTDDIPNTINFCNACSRRTLFHLCKRNFCIYVCVCVYSAHSFFSLWISLVFATLLRSFIHSFIYLFASARSLAASVNVHVSVYYRQRSAYSNE